MLKRPALVAVDGVDGSGKTTFAGRLVVRYQELGRTAHVVHLDDFLNRREIRYRLGRDSPEGFFRDTYDIPTFMTKVIVPLRTERPQFEPSTIARIRRSTRIPSSSRMATW